MKLKIISYSATKGGAAKAARNFLSLVDNNSPYRAELISVYGTLKGSEFTKASTVSIMWHFVKMLISRFFTYFGRDNGVVKYSLNLFSSNYVIQNLELSSQNEEIIHINWINNDTISIFSLKTLCENPCKKVLLTLHDEWFYCATEHYAEYDSSAFINGYNKTTFIKNYIFNHKKKIDFNNVVISVPSQWLLDRAKQSQLLQDAEIYILPNAIDTDIFRCQLDIRLQRHTKLNICQDAFVIGFGAISGSSNPLKGFDLLIASLGDLINSIEDKNKVILLQTEQINESTRSVAKSLIWVLSLMLKKWLLFITTLM
jgi:glycosyltransferase involved in cell wall biosynthesis